MQKFNAHITVKDKGKENVVFFKFTEEDMDIAMNVLEGILRFADGETYIFAQRNDE